MIKSFPKLLKKKTKELKTERDFIKEEFADWDVGDIDLKSESLLRIHHKNYLIYNQPELRILGTYVLEDFLTSSGVRLDVFLQLAHENLVNFVPSKETHMRMFSKRHFNIEDEGSARENMQIELNKFGFFFFFDVDTCYLGSRDDGSVYATFITRSIPRTFQKYFPRLHRHFCEDCLTYVEIGNTTTCNVEVLVDIDILYVGPI